MESNDMLINDVPFINDEDVIGRWEFFDVINFREEFDEHKPISEFQGLGFKEIYFIPNGEKYWIFEGWTKGLLFTHCGGDEPVICNKYEIRKTINGMFMLLDVHADSEPYINVLKKACDKRYVITEIGVRDNIDLPFIMDEPVLGLWKSVDYIQSIKDFKPMALTTNRLWLKSIRFNSDGISMREYTDETWYGNWTKGKLIDKKKITASNYEIKLVDRKEYLFLEWKMGNYVYGGAKPDYYVFERFNK